MNTPEVFELRSVPMLDLQASILDVKPIVGEAAIVTLRRLCEDVDQGVHRSLLEEFGSMAVTGRFADSVPLSIFSAESTDPRIFGGTMPKYRDVHEAFRFHQMRYGCFWELVWALARIQKDPLAWEFATPLVALGSPVSDGFNRQFPYVRGSAERPTIRLIDESSVADPKLGLKYIGRPSSESLPSLIKVKVLPPASASAA